MLSKGAVYILLPLAPTILFPLPHHLIAQILPLYFGNSSMTPPSPPIRPYPALLYT